MERCRVSEEELAHDTRNRYCCVCDRNLPYQHFQAADVICDECDANGTWHNDNRFESEGGGFHNVVEFINGQSDCSKGIPQKSKSPDYLRGYSTQYQLEQCLTWRSESNA